MSARGKETAGAVVGSSKEPLGHGTTPPHENRPMFTSVFGERGKRGRRGMGVPRVQIFRGVRGSNQGQLLINIYVWYWVLRYYAPHNPWFFNEIGRGKDRGRGVGAGYYGTTVNGGARHLPHGDALQSCVRSCRVTRSPSPSSWSPAPAPPRPPHTNLTDCPGVHQHHRGRLGSQSECHPDQGHPIVTRTNLAGDCGRCNVNDKCNYHSYYKGER